MEQILTRYGTQNKNMTTILKVLSVLKTYIHAAILFLGGFFLPLQPLIVVVTTAAIFDWISKLYSVYKTHGKKSIKSNKMQDTFFKIIVYALFLGTLHIVDIVFVKTFLTDILNLIFEESTVQILIKIQFAVVGTLMILVRECKSIDENWEDAFGYSPLDSVYGTFKFLFKWKS